MTALNRQMRALVLDSYEEGTVFRDALINLPSPSAGQVQVKIFASGVNPIDYKIRQGIAPYAMPELPAVLGTDLAGEIVAIGDGVTDFAIGDAVYGLTGGVRGLQGSLAEYANVDAELLALKPKNLSMREAAALPLVALTAWEGLVDKANVKAGQKILIQGGAGGVGHLAVQIAKALGADVYATASTGKQELLKALGATPIDYHTVSPAEYGRIHPRQRIRYLYDTVGGSVLDASLGIIAHYGHILSCAAFSSHNLAPSSLRSATLSAILCYTHSSAERGANITVTFCGKLRRSLKLDKLSHYSIRYAFP